MKTQTFNLDHVIQNKLTEREYQILSMLGDGQGCKGIARNLGIVEGTVKRHLQTIYAKLEISCKRPGAGTEAAILYWKWRYSDKAGSDA